MLEESVSSDHDTVDGQFSTEQFLHKDRGVAETLLDDNRAVFDGEDGPETAWNLKTLYTCNQLESNHVITTIAKHVTNQVSCVLGMNEITPQCLRSGLPRLNLQQRARVLLVLFLVNSSLPALAVDLKLVKKAVATYLPLMKTTAPVVALALRHASSNFRLSVAVLDPLRLPNSISRLLVVLNLRASHSSSPGISLKN